MDIPAVQRTSPSPPVPVECVPPWSLSAVVQIEYYAYLPANHSTEVNINSHSRNCSFCESVRNLQPRAGVYRTYYTPICSTCVSVQFHVFWTSHSRKCSSQRPSVFHSTLSRRSCPRSSLHAQSPLSLNGYCSYISETGYSNMTPAIARDRKIPDDIFHCAVNPSRLVRPGCPKYTLFTGRGIQKKSKKIYAMAGNRTRINCLEGNYADHYTTIAVEGNRKFNIILCFDF
ncbi:uncharacterized protein LOC132924706 [Rhopalosiphum padi]|uniref:uncharacterized protein LOC132924706 n=1 Tax=Rhopalosiphum padi TaxID=40932 RepID=UPI00298DC7C7|nr:uncharacterized protein LOC132924706 [Rhopalosiphum padi]